MQPSTARETKYMVSPEQAAEMLSVDRATVLRLIKRGKLKATKLGPKTIRVKIADIEAMITANQL